MVKKRNNKNIKNNKGLYNTHLYNDLNYYKGGGPLLSDITNGNNLSLAKTFSGANMGNMLKGGIGAIGSAVGQVGGNLIGGGLESGAGKAISGIGSAAGNLIGKVNPLMGGIVSAASGIVGGLTNRMFGSKLNQEEINKVNSSNTKVGNTVVDNSNFDTIEDQWGSQDMGQDFTMGDIGKDGWFSNKAKKKYNELLTAQQAARNRALTGYENAATSADLSTDLTALANYSAFGGPLNIYSTGGGIYIKPENRGKFTALKERTGKSSTWYKEYGTPEQKKMATFALNAAKWHALGGPLNTNGADFTNGIVEINNGGTHEENSLEGVPMGTDGEGTPNLVEEGEVVYDDYVYSKRLKANSELLKDAGLPSSYSGKSFADIAKNLEKESKERPNDPISKRGLQDSMQKLQNAQEILKQQQTEEQMQKNRRNQNPRQFATGGYTMEDATDYGVPIIDVDPYSRKAFFRNYSPANLNSYDSIKLNSNSSASDEKTPWWRDTANLRYAPIIGASIGLMQNLLSKPDYSAADKLEVAADSAGSYMPVSYNPIGNYLTYNPLDRNYYTNKLNAQASATRRAIMNTSSPSRNASLLAADYNTQNQSGTLARQAEEYNAAQRQSVETFNRGTNQVNSEMALKAAMANQSALAQSRAARLSGIVESMKMRNAIDTARGAAYTANLTNLFNSLGDIGRESYSRNMIMSNPALYYSIDSMGNVTYKNGYESLSEAEKKEVRNAANKAKKKKAKGGYLTIKKGGR